MGLYTKALELRIAYQLDGLAGGAISKPMKPKKKIDWLKGLRYFTGTTAALVFLFTGEKSSEANFQGESSYPQKSIENSDELVEKPSLESLIGTDFLETLSKKMQAQIEEINYRNSLHEIERNILDTFDKFEIPEYISKEFIRGQIWAESRDYAKAVGKGGERGLMQISRAAWEQVEKEIPYAKAFDSKTNIMVGTKYDLWINNLLEKEHPDWNNLSTTEKMELLVAGYNVGVGRLKNLEWDFEKVPARTKLYLKWIRGYMNKTNF